MKSIILGIAILFGFAATTDALAADKFQQQKNVKVQKQKQVKQQKQKQFVKQQQKQKFVKQQNVKQFKNVQRVVHHNGQRFIVNEVVNNKGFVVQRNVQRFRGNNFNRGFNRGFNQGFNQRNILFNRNNAFLLRNNFGFQRQLLRQNILFNSLFNNDRGVFLSNGNRVLDIRF